MQPEVMPLWFIAPPAKLLNPEPGKKVREVKLRQPPTWPSYLVRGFGSVSSAILILGVVPFLMFFMLVRKDKWYQTMAQLLGPKNDPLEFSNSLALMVRRFMIGNLAAGLFMASVTVVLLWALKIQGALILGVVSGLLNLIPFLGAILATLVPVTAGLIQAAPVSTLLIIGFAVVGIHIVSSNFIFPRLIGARMNIGPVAATAGILFWGWLWGPMGVLLSIPLTGVMKLIADCHPSLIHLSNMLGESPEAARMTVAGDKEIGVAGRNSARNHAVGVHRVLVIPQGLRIFSQGGLIPLHVKLSNPGTESYIVD